MRNDLPRMTMLLFAWVAGGLFIGGCSPRPPTVDDTFENEVADYIRAIPYQDTYDYAVRCLQGDPEKLNTWVLGTEPVLVKAGQDSVVRMNNDTFYKVAFLLLDDGPVRLTSIAPASDRFYSFQLMDDRNANYRNVVSPDGMYTLYHGTRPETPRGEAIEVPSRLSVVIVRVEVKDMTDANDLAAARSVFNGIDISGPRVKTLPDRDVLSGFDPLVEAEALRRIDEAFRSTPFSKTTVGPGQEPGRDVPYLLHAAGTRGGWGGPDPAHSTFETIFTDVEGSPLDGANGAYEITTEEPPVGAFWSITVYDTERGGYLHPNRHNRYHINNTTAAKNSDGTITITLKPETTERDVNCLEVPSGRFDIVARYYLPADEIVRGEWTMPRPRMVRKK